MCRRSRELPSCRAAGDAGGGLGTASPGPGNGARSRHLPPGCSLCQHGRVIPEGIPLNFPSFFLGMCGTFSPKGRKMSSKSNLGVFSTLFGV